MSIAIIKIHRSKLRALRQIANAMEAKMRVVKEDDYSEELMAKLIEEGLQSEIIPEEVIRKDFKKHGVNL